KPLQDDFPGNISQGCIETLINVVTSIPTCELLGPFESLAPLITVTESAIAVADPEQVCTQCNKDIIIAFDNFLKNNTFALQVLAQSGINQKSIDTMKLVLLSNVVLNSR
ncbi:25302_t:CDS:2, partial [Gigaspora rosea]